MNFQIKICILTSMFFLSTSTLMAQANKKKQIEKNESQAPAKQVVELKTRPLSLLFKTLNLSFEKQINKTISAELSANYLWGNPFPRLFTSYDDAYKLKLTGLNGNLNFRYYINDSSKGMDRFYTGAYMAGGSRKVSFTDISVTPNETESARLDRFAIGFLLGYKIVSKENKISFDFTGGLGRAFLNKTTYISENSSVSEEEFTGPYSIDGFLNFRIGYRF